MKRIAVECMALALLIVPAIAGADCPNVARCWQLQTHVFDLMDNHKNYNTFAPQNSIELGVIETPTCWRFGLGCRPWHCANNYTTPDYWMDECLRRYPPIRMPDIRVINHICVTFPGGVVVDNYCRPLDQ